MEYLKDKDFIAMQEQMCMLRIITCFFTFGYWFVSNYIIVVLQILEE
jgi:hypothetical protein